jgi:hypothetical protein
MTNLVETKDITKKFSESVVLVRLQLSRFGTDKIDKDKSKEFRDLNGVTSKDAAKVTKKLLPKSKSLEALKSHDAATWNRLKRHGAPYSKGVLMIAASKFLEATAQLRVDLANRGTYIRACGQDYDMSKAAAKATLGSTYNDADYPTTEEFLSEFTHEFDVLPIADPSQLNLAVMSDVSDAIQQAVNDTYHEKIATLAPHIRSVLLEPLVRLSETCQRILDTKGETRVFASAFDNVHAAAEQAKGLNIFEDDQIRNAVYQIEQVIPQHAGGIKEDLFRCNQIRIDTNSIIESLDGVPPLTGAAIWPCDPVAESPEPVHQWTEESMSEATPLTKALESVTTETNTTPADNDVLSKLGWV